MDRDVETLCGTLVRSRLLSPAEVQAAYQRWSARARERGSADPFTHWLIQQQLLTQYQAGLIARGLVDDFFLDDYKVLERVGRGRMAGVYKAARPDGTLVAVKVLPPSRARVPDLLARFQREARLSLRCDHPNVVRSLQLGETRGLHYLAMELLEGETLEELLQRRGTLPAVEAAQLIRQAMLGLQHLHEHGIVHRDLKPANLMVVPGVGPLGTVKILDIGLARELFEEAPGGEHAQELDGLTQEGVLLGTPDYLSPEQARDPRTIDVRSDLYSLGCTLYHLLTGQPPFHDGNALALMIRHATETPRPVRELNPALPEGIQQVLNYLLAKQPDQRYPTPARAAEALQAFLETDSPASPPLAERPRTPTPVRRRPPSGRKSDPAIPVAVPVPAPSKPAAVARPVSAAPVLALHPKKWLVVGMAAGALMLVVLAWIATIMLRA